MVIDLRRCVGCHACTVSCKFENNVPEGNFRTWVKVWEKGSWEGQIPAVALSFLPRLCNHCLKKQKQSLLKSERLLFFKLKLFILWKRKISMNKYGQFFDDFFGLEDHNHNHVRTYSLLVTLFFVFTSVLAMLLFPGYSISNDFLSTLGTHRARFPFIFNISTILTALLLLPTYHSINKILERNVPSNHGMVLNLALFFGITSSIALAGVGFFPAEGNTFQLHALSALSFFLSIGVYYLILSYLIIRILLVCHNFRSFLTPLDYFGFTFIVLVLLLVDLSTWYSRILQKFIVYSALLFLVYMTSKVHRVDHLNQMIHGTHE